MAQQRCGRHRVVFSRSSANLVGEITKLKVMTTDTICSKLGKLEPHYEQALIASGLVDDVTDIASLDAQPH